MLISDIRSDRRNLHARALAPAAKFRTTPIDKITVQVHGIGLLVRKYYEYIQLIIHRNASVLKPHHHPPFLQV